MAALFISRQLKKFQVSARQGKDVRLEAEQREPL